MKKQAVLAMDIGGTHIRAGLVDEQFVLSGFKTVRSAEIFRDEAHAVGHLADFISGLIAAYTAEAVVGAVSLGFPSSIDKARRKLLSTPNIKGLDNLPVADMLEDALHIPVVLGRDVNMLFSYDCHNLALDMRGTVIACYFGTGLGNTVAIDGRILYGRNGVAGELGHIPARGDQATCGCGNIGCVENFCAGKYLASMAARHFPDTPIGEIFLRHADSPVIADYLEGMSLPVATEITILDPEYVILGGGILQMEGFPFAQFEACIRRHTRKPYPEANLRLVYSRPAQENGVIGAGIYAYANRPSLTADKI